MEQWAVEVRYPGAPRDIEAPAMEHLPSGVDIGSMTVCAEHTTMHIRVQANTSHGALDAGLQAGDQVARSIGLDTRWAVAATPLH